MTKSVLSLIVTLGCLHLISGQQKVHGAFFGNNRAGIQEIYVTDSSVAKMGEVQSGFPSVQTQGVVSAGEDRAKLPGNGRVAILAGEKGSTLGKREGGILHHLHDIPTFFRALHDIVEHILQNLNGDLPFLNETAFDLVRNEFPRLLPILLAKFNNIRAENDSISYEELVRQLLVEAGKRIFEDYLLAVAEHRYVAHKSKPSLFGSKFDAGMISVRETISTLSLERVPLPLSRFLDKDRILPLPWKSVVIFTLFLSLVLCTVHLLWLYKGSRTRRAADFAKL